MTTEGTFDILADAAGCQYPNPDRESRGLCPAHADENNPGLVFRISEDTGNLVVHCFARHCTLDDIADSIGVPTSAFFKGGSSNKWNTRVHAEWKEPSALELFKQLGPLLGMDTEEQHEAVFNLLDSAFDNGATCPKHDTFDIEQPLREMSTNTILAYLWEYAKGWLNPDKYNWHEVSDTLLSYLRQLNREQRYNQAGG